MVLFLGKGCILLTATKKENICMCPTAQICLNFSRPLGETWRQIFWYCCFFPPLSALKDVAKSVMNPFPFSRIKGTVRSEVPWKN